VAFAAVAHCHYFVRPPTRQLWYAIELGLALLLWPFARPIADWVLGVLRTQSSLARWVPSLGGVGLAAWWHGRLADTFWLHGPALQPVMDGLLFLAYAIGFGTLIAVAIALLAVSDPVPTPDGPCRRPSSATVAVFIAFLAAANALVVWYVGQESTLYYADFAYHWARSADWAALCRHDPLAGWDSFRRSVQSDGYTLLPAAGPAAGIALFDDSRLVFVLAVANTYLFAVAVTAWRFVNRFAPESGWLAAAVPTAMLATIPVAWSPILRGYYDVGGVALGIAALTIYLSRPRADVRWPQLLGLAALLAGAVLFRRWYTFWVAAFVALVGLECGIAAAAAALRRRWADAGCAIRPAIALGVLVPLGLVALALPAVMATVGSDYSDAFAAYHSQLPLRVRLGVLASNIGPGYLLAAGVATVYLAARPQTRRVGLFVAGMVPLIIAAFLRVQDFNPHHLSLLLPVLLLPPSVAAARMLTGRPSWLAAAAVAGGTALGAVGLAPVVDPDWGWVRPRLRPLVSECQVHPLKRADLPEIRQMLAWLDAEAGSTGETFTLLASSTDLHQSMIGAAERSLQEPFRARQLQMPTSDVDRVSGFPVGLFRASLVLVPSPPQTHLRPGEQEVIAFPSHCLLTGTGIGRAFDRLPVGFHLQNGITVFAYRRVRPVDPADFAALCEHLRRSHPTRPHVFTPPVPEEELLAVPSPVE
jgi:hypothetical protein